MERVPPEERFSQNEKALDVPASLMAEALKRAGCPAASPLKLPGGFMNANYRVQRGREALVLRFYSSEMFVALREREVTDLLGKKGVLAPELLDLFELEGRPVGVMRFIDGRPLIDSLGRKAVPSLTFRGIGEQLAQIHSITFPKPGWIMGGLEIDAEFSTFGALIRGFIQHVLGDLEAKGSGRLSLDHNHRVRKLVEDKWHLVTGTEPVAQLTHCDFNPKNLLVSDQGALLATIDWEFATSGNGLIDLGNFFRFHYDYEPGTEEELIAGYTSVKPLPANWLEIAKLLDLGNMASFLERKEDYQKSFRTARIVIAETLKHFGY